MGSSCRILVNHSQSELAWDFGSEGSYLYHEYLQAEVSLAKHSLTQAGLNIKKGDVSTWDLNDLQSPVTQALVAKYPEFKRLQDFNKATMGEVERQDPSLKYNLKFNLKLEHVYGFQCFDRRECIKLTSDKFLIYPVGSRLVGMMLNSQEDANQSRISESEEDQDPETKQAGLKMDHPLKYFSYHQTAVSCFDLYDELEFKLIVSAEMTAENNIIVWDCENFSVKATLKSIFEKGVSKIKFSNKGKYIAVVGVSEDLTQVLTILNYQKIEAWAKSGRKDDKLESITKLGADPVLDLVFDSQDQSLYILAGKSLLAYHFSANGDIVEADWRGSEPELLTCLSFKKGRTILTGTISGNLIHWNGSEFNKSDKLHKRAINCMEKVDSESASFHYITGGDDCHIKFWTDDFKLEWVIEVNQVMLQDPHDAGLFPEVTSVSWKERTFVFSTRSGEIFQAEYPEEFYNEEQHHKPTTEKNTKMMQQLLESLRPIIIGHSDEEMTGIALCYSVQEMFTIGSNNILMHWNYEKKKLLRRKKIDFPGKLLTISLNNSFLVVGCYNGTTLILNTSNLTQTHAHNIEKSEVTALTFSPSNENLVIGFINGNVNILSTPQKFKLMHVLRSSYQNPVMALDFSDDNLLLKVTYKDLDAAVYDAVKGAKCNTGLDMSRFSPRGSNRNDLRWGQWRSPVGYSVQGIWGEYTAPSDIAGVVMNQDRDMVVVWDIHGGVKIFKYPVLNPQTPFMRISGTSGTISAALFDNDSNYLIILGSKDASISQYKVCRDDPKAVEKVMMIQRNFVDKQYQSIVQHQSPAAGQQSKGKQPTPFLKGLPMLWPSKPNDGLMSKDFSCINLEILSGVGLNYQNFKEPILVASDETLVYFCGTTFVKHKISADTDIHAIQLSSRSYSQFHTKRVQSMDLSKSLKYVATGEAIDHKKPNWESEVAEVIVHDFQKAEVITKMKLTPGESAIFVKMNPSETQLLVITQTPKYQKLTIYDWINSTSVHSVFIGTNKINDVAFASDEKFATVGNNHVIFWTLNGVSLTPKNGMYSNHEITEFSACAFAFEKKHLFTGTISGHLGMWSDNNYVNPVQAHKSPILLMKKFKKDSLFTADAEGVIFRWGFSTDLTKPSEVFDLKDMYSRPSRYLSINPSLQDVILVSENGDAIRAGTKNKPSKIFSDLTSKVTAVCLVDQELYILTESPFFFVYDIARQVLKPPKPVVDKSVYYTAIVSYFNQKKFVVADSKGYLRMFSEGLESQIAKQSTTLVQEGRIIHLMRVTENETFLLVASMVEGGKIGLVSLGNQQLQVQIYLNPEIVGFVKAMDWDIKGDLFVVNSSLGELVILSKDKKGVVPTKEARDAVWLTHTTMFNFFSGGLHSRTDGSTDITAVYTRPDLPFLLAGTESGGLFVERNPCVSFSKRKEVHQAHLGPVEEIQMSQKSQIVISRSADSVFVWRYSTRDSKWQMAKAELAPKLGQIGKAIPEIFKTSKALAGERPTTEFDFKKVVYKRGAYDDPLRFRRLRELRRAELKKMHHIKKDAQDGNDMDSIIQQLAQARSRSNGYSTLEKDASLAQFKQEILYHSTYLKKSAPEVKVKYLCSYGAETTEFRPTVHLFSNNQDILTFSKSFPTILCAFNQLRHDSHATIVTSVAAHPNNTIVASSSEDSEIHVWEYNSNLLLSKFRAPITGGALKLSFSDNEKHLAGIFVQNNFYYLIVFDIHQQTHLAIACLGSAEVRSLMYKKKLEIVTVGENHLSIWKLHNGNLLGDSIDFKDYCSDLYSQGMNKLDMVIGSGNQSLLVLREVIHSELTLNKTLEKPNVSAPAGARDSQNKRMSVLSKAVLSSSQGNKILGISVSNLYMFAGAEDATVFVLSNNYIQLIVISLAELIPSALDPMLVAVSTNNNFQGFVVLLRSGELAITKTQDIRISYESRFESDVVRQSHFNRQPNTISRITQVRATKNEYVFASIAEDGTLRKWDFSGGLEHERIADLAEREEPQDSNTPAITRKGEMGIGSSTLTCFDIQSDYAAIVGCGDGSLRVFFV